MDIMDTMDPIWLNAIVEFIRGEWQALPSELSPWGVWVAQHTPLPSQGYDSFLHANTIMQVWLLPGKKLPVQTRSISEYVRYVVMHFERPWQAGIRGSDDPRFGSAYPLGLADFAQISDTQDFYVSATWGRLNGRGWRVQRSTPEKLTIAEELWVS